MIGCILKSVDFERVLGKPSCARSPHFAVHFLAGVPSRRVAPPAGVVASELSTTVADPVVELVDESAPDGIWLGTVVPKRHARRAVTRNLLKRQIRQAVGHQAHGLEVGIESMGAVAVKPGLPEGLWVVRLRSPFDKKTFASASSESLKLAAAQELSTVLAHAARRVSA